MIGLKAVESLTRIGLKVTIIELTDRVLSTVLDKESSYIIHQHLKENNIELLTQNTVKNVFSIGKRIQSVMLKNSKKIKTDLIVIAIGVIPNLDLARSAGIKTNRGILVNEFMQTNIESIYAAGDVVESWDFLLRENRVLPIWPLAYEQGEIAGANMVGEKIKYQGGMMLNCIEIFNLPIITTDISVVEGDKYEILAKFLLKEKTCKKIVIQNEKIIGAILINDIQRAGIITSLIRNQLNVTGFKNEILKESFGYIYVPKEFRTKEISPLEV